MPGEAGQCLGGQCHPVPEQPGGTAVVTTLKPGVSQNLIKLLTSRQLLSLSLCSGRKLSGEHTEQTLGCQTLGEVWAGQQGWVGEQRLCPLCWVLLVAPGPEQQQSSAQAPRQGGTSIPLCRDTLGTPARTRPRPQAGPAAASARGREAGKHTSLLHLPLNKKSSKCLINSLGRNKNIMRKTIWLEKKMALASSLLLAVAVHMCLAEVVIRALANGLFTCFYIAPLYVLVILNLAAKRSSSEICVKP